MKTAIGFLAVLALVALAPGQASAQGRGGRGNVTTVYGTFSQAEMQAAGGDPSMAAQIREQKMQMQYEQQQMKQYQQYQQQMAKLQQQQKNQKKNGTASNDPNGATGTGADPFAPPAATKKKKNMAKGATKAARGDGDTASTKKAGADKEKKAGAETADAKKPAETKPADAKPAETKAPAGTAKAARSGA